MRIPKNATPEFFDKQLEEGTFNTMQWLRWVRKKQNAEYLANPEAYLREEKAISKRLLEEEKRKFARLKLAS